MAVTWTEDQRRVIETRGSNILVSAAAGSGKTAVLVARIMSLISEGEHPCDIDELLIVTFTRAAAGEMQERIAKAVAEALEIDPENDHLLRQSALLHNAHITTIDGFCASVVRDYGYTIGLVPGARIADEGELRLMEADVVQDVLEEAYAAGGEDPAFIAFVETFAQGKNDLPLEKLILSVYRRAVSEPDPEGWLALCRSEAEAVSLEEIEGTEWMQGFMQDVREDIRFALRAARENLELTDRPEGPSAYRPAAEAEYTLLTNLLEADGYEAMREVLISRPAVKLSGAKPKAGEDPGLRTIFKDRRAEVTSLVKRLSEEVLAIPLEEAAGYLAAAAGPVVTLTQLVSRFIERFAEEKRRRNLMDFADLEHFALRILKDEDGRTDAARELMQEFREVCVDEYQDSNYLQEAILTAVSRMGEPASGNYFCVGDVKQSIYSFRQARPELFMEKFEAYGMTGDGSLTSREARSDREPCPVIPGVRIDLSRNFRSREDVLASVNGIFSQIMRREIGGVSYTEDVFLVPGASYPDDPMRGGGGWETEIMPVLPGEAEEAADSATLKELEARAIARRIRDMVGHEQIADTRTGLMRPVEFRDIVILLRTMEGWADTFAEVLEMYQVPAWSSAKSGYFEAKEVQIVLNLLAILDNPHDDTAFVSVMMSPIADLSPEEMAQVRVLPGAVSFGGSTKREDIFLYTAARNYAEHGEMTVLREKLGRFFAFYDDARRRVPVTPLHELISFLLKRSGYALYAAAMPGGAQRELNLRMLVDKAVEYENTSYTGLFNFVRYIRNLQKSDVDFGELSTISEADNVVRIISIHKSKGLEYPVVFAAGMGKSFNRSDLNSMAVIHPDLGIATDYVDTARRVKVPTLRKAAIRARLLKDSLGEELRVLYVALTRAKQKLIITGTLKSAGALEELSLNLPLSEELLPTGYLIHVKTPWELILPAVDRILARDERSGRRSSLVLVPVDARDLAADEAGNAIRRGAVLEELRQNGGFGITPSEREAIEARFLWQYPYAGRENIPVEVSVSELKHRVYEELAGADPEREYESVYEAVRAIPEDGEGEPGFVPDFMKEKAAEEEVPVTGAARGTAYHAVMEHLVFPGAGAGENLPAEDGKEEAAAPGHTEDALTENAAGQIRALARRGILADREADAVNPADIAAFLQSALGQRMTQAAERGELVREQAFVLEVPASEIRPEWPGDEPVFVQGIIDAFFYEGEEIVLVDYKTDRVRSGRQLYDDYKVQLDSYAEALERVTGRRVKERWLWSFCLTEAVRV